MRRVSVVSWNPVIENSENLGKAGQKVEVTRAITRVTFFFFLYPMLLFVAIIAYIRRFLISFLGLQLVELKTTYFGDLPYRLLKFTPLTQWT